jgi:hypothetical protein
MLNLVLGEPLAFVQEFLFLDNPIKLDPLLESDLDPCVYYLISVFMFYEVMVELCWFQLFYDL